MTQLRNILVELEANQVALVQYIVYHEAVWTARGFGGYMFPEEMARANLLDQKLWSSRRTVEQRQRRMYYIRPPQQPRKRER